MAERGLRRDAALNRDRILDAALHAVRRDGLNVPMASIAAAAGVGVGTLYRHYPTREALLEALTERSFRLVVEHARRAAEHEGPAVDALTGFLEDTIRRRGDFLLPLHGGPAVADPGTAGLQSEIRALLEQVLRRGRADGSVRADVTPVDVIMFGALVAQPLPHVEDWDRIARRQARIYVAGLSPRP